MSSCTHVAIWALVGTFELFPIMITPRFIFLPKWRERDLLRSCSSNLTAPVRLNNCGRWGKITQNYKTVASTRCPGVVQFRYSEIPLVYRIFRTLNSSSWSEDESSRARQAHRTPEDESRLVPSRATSLRADPAL